eukprot:GHVO01014762.1.p1 GENE.GHVO01014762.1~~GHVO01014762.1.p1  ORF type:complete len:350 (-),score=71.67 GHVO01014762.1:166-1215(-)
MTLPPPPCPPVASPPTEQPNNVASLGIIFPPPEIKGIIDKTAQFVAKNGAQFEAKVGLQRENGKLKFEFLQTGNPYRPYYDCKVREFLTGETVTQPALPKAILQIRREADQKKKKTDQILALTAHKHNRPEKPEPPDPDVFCVAQPYIAPIDLDVVRLTAQFVARNGQKFLIGLTQRERSNAQFDFLKPTHALFRYFTAMVDSYTRCLIPDRIRISKLSKDAKDRGAMLERIRSRHHWEMQEEDDRKEKETKEAGERAQQLSVDWHDFVVVKVIEFTDEDDAKELPPPIDFSGGCVAPPPISMVETGPALALPPPPEDPVIQMRQDVPVSFGVPTRGDAGAPPPPPPSF